MRRRTAVPPERREERSTTPEKQGRESSATQEEKGGGKTAPHQRRRYLLPAKDGRSSSKHGRGRFGSYADWLNLVDSRVPNTLFGPGVICGGETGDKLVRAGSLDPSHWNESKLLQFT